MGLLDDAPGLDRFGAFQHRHELRRLQRLRRKDETIVEMVAGRDPHRTGILALTDQRVLWITRGLPGRRVRAFPVQQLTGVRVGIEDDQGVVTLESPKLTLAVARIDANAAKRFGDAAKTAAKDAGNATMKSKELDRRPPREELLSEKEARKRLEQLERMREKGSITQPEYLANRKRLEARSELPDPPSGSWWRRW